VPEEFWQWQWAVTGATALVAVVMGWRMVPAVVRILACAAVATGGAWWIVPDGEEGFAYMADFRAALIGLLAASVFFVWIAVDRASRRPQRLSLWWLAACAMVGAVVMFQSGNTKLAQLGGALGAAVFGVAVVCTWRPNADVVRGAIGPVVATLGGLSMSAYMVTFSEIPRACFVLVPLAPLSIVAGEWLTPRARGWIRSIVSAIAVVGVLALIVYLAFSFTETADEW
jgi:hypothetical protein